MGNKECRTNEELVREFKTFNNEGNDSKAIKCFTELLAKNTCLINEVVNKVKCSETLKEDLIQEGMVAIWKATLTFDETLNVEFKAYARKAVQLRVWSCYAKERSLIKLSYLTYTNLIKCIRCEERLLQDHNKADITPEIIAKETGLSVKEVIKCREIPGVFYDSDFDNGSEDGKTSLLDKIVDKNALRVYDEILTREAVRKEMERFLAPREKEIVTLLAGLDESGQMNTPSEVARKLHITNESVRQARKRASMKLSETKKYFA